jgi:hypothetical protein
MQHIFQLHFYRQLSNLLNRNTKPAGKTQTLAYLMLHLPGKVKKDGRTLMTDKIRNHDISTKFVMTCKFNHISNAEYNFQHKSVECLFVALQPIYMSDFDLKSLMQIRHS